MTALLVPGDFDRAANADLLSRASTAHQRLYSSHGKGGWPSWKRFGGGRNPMTGIVGPADSNGDGFMDVLGRHSPRQLWLYPGNEEHGRLRLSRVGYGYGWNAMTGLMGIEDFDGDTYVDLAARDTGRAMCGSTAATAPRLVVSPDLDRMQSDELLGAGDAVGLLGCRPAGCPGPHRRPGRSTCTAGTATGGWTMPDVQVRLRLEQHDHDRRLTPGRPAAPRVSR